MFKATLHADERTDPVAEAATIRARAEKAGLKAPQLDFLHAEVSAVLAELVETARQTAALGSQITATRTLKGEGYAINLSLRGNDKRSLLSKVFDSVRGR